MIALALMDQVDEAGYCAPIFRMWGAFRGDARARKQVVGVLQTLAPPGSLPFVGECLAIQLKQRDRLDLQWGRWSTI